MPLRRYLVSRWRPFWLSVTSSKKLGRSNKKNSSYRVNKTAAHEGDDNTCLPSGPRGDKNDFILRLLWYICMYVLVNVLRLYTRWNIKIQAHSCIVWFSRIFADPSLTKCCCQNYCPGCATDNKWKCSPIWPRNLLEASNQSCKGGATNSLNIAFSESGPWTIDTISVVPRLKFWRLKSIPALKKK